MPKFLFFDMNQKIIDSLYKFLLLKGDRRFEESTAAAGFVGKGKKRRDYKTAF